jgi:hypothetical protein
VSAAVDDILHRIRSLPIDERAELERRLVELEEQEWQREANGARVTASEKGIDQAAIDRAIHRTRYGE